MEQVFQINVGGKIYWTSKSTLSKYPDSMLGAMFSDRNCCLQKPYFIDRDGKLFRHVLNYLRDGSLEIDEGFQELAQLLREAEFFALEGLVQTVRDAMERRMSQHVMLQQQCCNTTDVCRRGKGRSTSLESSWTDISQASSSYSSSSFVDASSSPIDSSVEEALHLDPALFDLAPQF